MSRVILSGREGNLGSYGLWWLCFCDLRNLNWRRKSVSHDCLWRILIYIISWIEVVLVTIELLCFKSRRRLPIICFHFWFDDFRSQLSLLTCWCDRLNFGNIIEVLNGKLLFRSLLNNCDIFWNDRHNRCSNNRFWLWFNDSWLRSRNNNWFFCLCYYYW